MDSLKVFISGAAGRTGQLVYNKLAARGHEPIGLVRRKEQQAGLDGGASVVGDIREPASFAEALKQADALIILSSAVPQKEDAAEGAPPGPPKFFYKPGEEPEQIDWIGQKNQIDAAKGSNVKHVVLVGSMGSENPDHMLNKIGNGNILVWKRKAEQHLIDSGLTYTVINPGGLIDQPGGERELLVGKKDSFIQTQNRRAIPRADVAEVIVQALQHPEARNKAFDLVSRPPSEGETTQDWAALFSQTTAGL